ncbi:MAG: nitronate monooxygenase [Candidatus Lokiarchaeota archaeon]|nr:nitronate monooxygenase [Candidatus Lokiarchaeota archaeon]
MTIETKITKMFGIKHPIVCAPMGPFYTTDMCVAISEAGGLGILSHTTVKRGQDIGDETTTARLGADAVVAMKENMEYVVEHTDKPFGFNVRTSRNELQAEKLCTEIPKFILENQRIREQCVYALTSAGSSKTLPASKSFQELKQKSEIKHFHVAPALWLADKCVASGVDGIVVTGGEGGGHQSYEKVSSLVLLQQVQKKHPDVPKIACGGFATGPGLAAALSAGADAIAMGSRFIASKESEFHENYKGVVPPAKAQDTILVTGALGPIRLWRNEYSLHHGLVADKNAKIAEEERLRSMSREDMIKEFLATSNAYLAAYRGDITSGAVLLGQSIGVIESIESCADIINEVVSDAESLIKNVAAGIK